MTQEEFETKLHEMFMPKDGDSNYDTRKAEATKLIDAAIWDTTQYCGGTWNNETAAERFKQWEWVRSTMDKPKKPEVISLPESTLHRIYKEYLHERGYSANKIPEIKGKKTPDFLIKRESVELLNEFKAPELVFNQELNLYKFQTTHSKILTFISKAVKQLRADDSTHDKPWVVTFASTHFQLNWSDFLNTLRGGVAYDSKLSPDFTNTDMFKRVIKKAQEIDLYIWLQVNPTDKYIYQVSFIINKDSKYLNGIKKFVADMKTKDISSMDNLLTLDWTTV